MSRASERFDHLGSLRRDGLQPGKLIIRLNAADILPSNGPAQISNFKCIASYNWLDKSEPTVLVPGKSISRQLSMPTEILIDC